MAEYPSYITNPEPATDNDFLQLYAQDPAALRGVVEDSLSRHDYSALAQLGGTAALGGAGLLAGRRFARPLAKWIARKVPEGNLQKLAPEAREAAYDKLKDASKYEAGLPGLLASVGSGVGFLGGSALSKSEELAPMAEFRAILDDIEGGELTAEEKREAYKKLEKGLEARDAASGGTIALLAGLAAGGAMLPRSWQRFKHLEGLMDGGSAKKVLQDKLSLKGPMNPQRYSMEAAMNLANYEQKIKSAARRAGANDAMIGEASIADYGYRDAQRGLLEDLGATTFGLGVGALAASDYENPLAP